MQTKNEKYKEELAEANEKIRASKPRMFLRAKFPDLNSTLDDASGFSSVQTMQRRQNRRNQPRKTQMIFQDVKQKLAEMCMESQEIKRNMEGMAKTLKNKKRKSLNKDLSLNLGNESFMRTMEIHEIEEVEEEEEEEDFVRDKAYSLIVKDEISNCKSKMDEYVELIKEMTLEVERVDQENEILCDDMDALGQKVDELEEHNEMLLKECGEWNKKFLTVLSELEESKRANDEIDEKLIESNKEIEILKKRPVHLEEGNEVIKDLENLLEENTKLKEMLKKTEFEKNLVNQEKNNLEENVSEVKNSYNNLNSIFQKVVEKKDFFKNQINKIEQKHKIDDKELKLNLENEILTLNEKVKKLENENRELNSEVKILSIKNLELESEVNFQNNQNFNEGLNSQLENSQMLLDVTYDAGVSEMYKDLEGNDKIFTESHNQSLFGKKQDKTMNNDDSLNNILGESFNQEIYHELGDKNEEIKKLENEKMEILRNKKDEINEIEDKLIQTQKDALFEKEKLQKRFGHESKIWKKEKKKKNKEIKLMEKKLVQLKIQTSNLFVEKDELEMSLTKQIRLLQIKVLEYEKNIKQFNNISKTKDKKGFWDKMFN